jgi:hypothetical protein
VDHALWVRVWIVPEGLAGPRYQLTSAALTRRRRRLKEADSVSAGQLGRAPEADSDPGFLSAAH